MNQDILVLTYQRVSTEDQAKTQSCNDQKAVIERYIISQGWKIAPDGDFRDEGLSGSYLPEDRPGLQDLIIRCSQDRTIKVVVVTETDRLARGNKAYIPIRETLKQFGVKVVAVTQLMVDDSDEGEMLGEIFGAINGFFSKITRRKSMRALDEKARKHIYPSKAPLGYRNVNIGTEDKPERVIEVDEERKPYITQIPKLYNSGKSYEEIADILYDQGLRGNEGGKASAEMIRKIIFSDFYLGKFTWRGVIYDGNQQPLFKWFDIQKARKRSHEKSHCQSTKDLRDKFLFKRLPILCKTCECHITAEAKVKHYPRTQRTVTYTFYRCTKSKGRDTCQQPAINKEDLLAEFITKIVQPISIDEELAQFLMEEIDKDFTNNKETQEKLLTGVHVRLGQIESELRNLFEMRLSGKITPLGGRTSDEVFEEYKMRKEIEQQKLLEAKRKIEEGNKDWREKASNFFLLCCDATNKFIRGTEQQQYLFLRTVSSDLFLDNKRLVVTHQFPFSEFLKRDEYPGMLRLVDVFSNREIGFDHTLDSIKILYSNLNLQPPMFLTN